MAKQEATPAPAPAPAPAPGSEAPAAPSKIAGLLPVILVVVLAPVVSWAVAQFVILPQFEKKLNAVAAASGDAHGAASEAPHGMAEPVAAEKGGEGHGGKKGEAAGPSNSYEFPNIVVNLAGTMGTRYLKTTFLVTGKDPNLREYFSRNKAQMVDVTLNVLSSLSLADLEEAGAKNIIREKLVNAYNQAIGKKVAEQVYFSDFVVQ